MKVAHTAKMQTRPETHTWIQIGTSLTKETHIERTRGLQRRRRSKEYKATKVFDTRQRHAGQCTKDSNQIRMRLSRGTDIDNSSDRRNQRGSRNLVSGCAKFKFKACTPNGC
jgi:hypothetical protein